MASSTCRITNRGVGHHKLQAKALGSRRCARGTDARRANPHFADSAFLHVLDALATKLRVAKVLAGAQGLHALVGHGVGGRVILHGSATARPVHAAVLRAETRCW